ncbi:helix-turn-helix transcriptional regulator [Lentzea sp. NBRC 102530]|uniref:helix-turn-helix domain-containing protein n=1 Tax=Lentzea sp. NBRC 102530 TaxID=3032201 RepID=UPI0025528809|nr:helix-turn-helix transcriptional regulator [Lentzea sp. NBRC 102530]
MAFRRFNALAVQQWRLERGWFASRLAEELNCTVTKVSYIEGAERSISVNDMEKLLRVFEIPEDQHPIYINAAKASKQKGWWDKLPAGTIPPWFSLFVGLEAGAAEIRAFEGLVIPGLLQTPDYAAAVIAGGTAELTTADIELRQRVRIGRQSVLDRQPEPLRLWAVIDEAALWRVVGNPMIHLAQLEHLLSVIKKYPRVTILVIPFSSGAHVGSQGSFTLMDFPWSHDPGVVYLENQYDSQFMEDKVPGKTVTANDQEDGEVTKKPSPLAVHRLAWDHLVAKALDPLGSEAKIEEVMKELKRR